MWWRMKRLRIQKKVGSDFNDEFEYNTEEDGSDSDNKSKADFRLLPIEGSYEQLQFFFAVVWLLPAELLSAQEST